MIFTQMRLLNRGSRSMFLPAHLSLSLAFAVVFLLTMLGSDIIAHLKQYLLDDLPQQEIRVGLKKQDTGFFRFIEPGAATQITQLDQLAALDGVTGVYPLIYGEQPAVLEVNILGRGMRTDVAVQGFPTNWISGDVPAENLAWQRGQPIPAVINPRLLSIYNSAYAKGQGLPELTETAVTAPVFNLRYGPPGKALMLKTKIVGFSKRVGMALCIPDSVLRDMHQQLALKPPTLTDVRLRLTRNTNPDHLKDAIAQLGYQLAPANPLAEAVSQLTQFGTTLPPLLAAFTALFCLAFLHQTIRMLFLLKAGDYAVCHAMGMSLSRLRLLLSLELILTLCLDLITATAAAGMTAAWLRNSYLSPFIEGLTGQILAPTPITGLIAAICGALLLAGQLTLLPHLLRFNPECIT